MVETTGLFILFNATKPGTLPFPFAGNPIVVSEFVQVNAVLGSELTKLVCSIFAESHTAIGGVIDTIGTGFIITFVLDIQGPAVIL